MVFVLYIEDRILVVAGFGVLVERSWLWKELGAADFLFCSNVRESLLRVNPPNSASKSNVPWVAGLAGAWVGLGAILTGAGLTGAACADG